ncbi:hypothetical protein GCM10007301_30160 [Azorhizobium oxalatiphilum]|uniref:Hemin uptake protein hemP n=1 Tax=Azorhizobium oxalatiphilum TaxID=980631 RepID=A0A917C335_9HYPH|nr:hemin uptake protein HemP [Azorhizobium oxalatiphilum]GGF68459.1 hypothetical protein GCM10007301_30160 [Azorhizobium oxalatiphilum]
MALLERMDVIPSGTSPPRRSPRTDAGGTCRDDMDGQSPSRVVWMMDGTLDSASLFQTGRTIRILHDGQVYVLRLTSNDKIILTK